MPDVTYIAAILNSIKLATDSTKFLRESDLSLERAELKLKLADLVSALAEAKIQLAEIQDTFSEKDKRIAELEDAFQSKESLTRHLDAYYTTDDKGNPVGVAFCLRCWENDQKKRQLVNDAKDRHMRVCTACGHRYQDYMSFEMRKV